MNRCRRARRPTRGPPIDIRQYAKEKRPCPRCRKESSPNVDDIGPALDIGGHLDDDTVDFVTIRQGHSLAVLLKGLPGDSCHCPHWGYLFSGKITVSYADHEEVTRPATRF